MLAYAMKAPKHWVPGKFMEERSKPDYVAETDETITSYKILMQIPALKHVWEEAMCKELGKISNGWKDTEGTQTVRFLTHEETHPETGETITSYKILIQTPALKHV